MNSEENYSHSSSSGWLNESWHLFQEQSGPFLGAAFLCIMISLAMTVVTTLFIEVPLKVIGGQIGVWLHAAPAAWPAWAFPVKCGVGLINHLVSCFLAAGLLKMSLAAMRKEPVKWTNIFSGSSFTLRLFCYSLPVALLFTCVIHIPFTYMMPPVIAHGAHYGKAMAVENIGIFLASLLHLFIYPGEALIVSGVPMRDAYRRSIAGVVRNFWLVLGVALLLCLLAMLSICTLGLGLLVVIPLHFIVLVIAARDIAGLPIGPVTPPLAEGPAIPGAWPPAPSATAVPSDILSRRAIRADDELT